MDDYLLSDYEVRLDFPKAEIDEYVGVEVALPEIASETRFLFKKWGIVNGKAPKLQIVFESDQYAALAQEISLLGYETRTYEYYSTFIAEEKEFYFHLYEDYYIMEDSSLVKNGRLSFVFYALQECADNPLPASEETSQGE